MAVPEVNHKEGAIIIPFASNLDDVLYYHENESIQKEYEKLISTEEYSDDKKIKQQNIICKAAVNVIRDGHRFDGNIFYPIGQVLSISKDKIEVYTPDEKNVSNMCYIPRFTYDDNGYIIGIHSFILFYSRDPIYEFLTLYTKLRTNNMVDDYIKKNIWNHTDNDVFASFDLEKWSSYDI